MPEAHPSVDGGIPEFVDEGFWGRVADDPRCTGNGLDHDGNRGGKVGVVCEAHVYDAAAAVTRSEVDNRRLQHGAVRR